MARTGHHLIGGVVAAAICALLLLGAAGSAAAATLVVRSAADSGPGSLREAIEAANRGPGEDRVEFSAGIGGEIELRSMLPVVSAPLRIVGPGPDRLAISGGGAEGILDLELAGGGEVAIEALTLRDGAGADGGAIVAFDTEVVLERVNLTGNRATNAGGAVSVTGGGVTLLDSRLEGNSASYPGGALQVQDAELRAIGTTFAGNTAGSSGGGIYVAEPGSRTEIRSSTVRDNAAGGDGGGIAVGGSPYPVLELRDSKVAGNHAEGEGADVYPPHEGAAAGAGGAGDDDGLPALPPASAGSNGTTTEPSEATRALLSAPLGSLQTGDGPGAALLDGIALAPPGAPPAVQAAIDAANSISHLPYIWGGGHASWYAPGYDCSGAVSFALWGAGLLSVPLTSGQLASWGAPGPGRWITIYANPSHTFAVIAGLRWDTAGQAQGSGPRWHTEPASTVGYVVRHPPGY